jgi:hypothetical protein
MSTDGYLFSDIPIDTLFNGRLVRFGLRLVTAEELARARDSMVAKIRKAKRSPNPRSKDEIERYIVEHVEP